MNVIIAPIENILKSFEVKKFKNTHKKSKKNQKFREFHLALKKQNFVLLKFLARSSTFKRRMVTISCALANYGLGQSFQHLERRNIIHEKIVKSSESTSFTRKLMKNQKFR